MLIAARRAKEFVAGIDESTFANSPLHQSAVVKQLEIIGEAAYRITAETRDAHSEIPWSEMTGMRHRLVHDYRNIDVALVWDTATHDLDPLISQLEPLIPPESEEDKTD